MTQRWSIVLVDFIPYTYSYSW